MQLFETACLSDIKGAKCIPVNCGDPPQLPNGKVIYPDTTLHTVAKYHCDAGFKPSPKSNLVLQCGSEAKWNGSAPVCVRKSCDTPLRPDRGGFHGDNFTFNSNIIYWCDEGYVLHGAYNATCLANGTWNNDAPDCEGQSIYKYLVVFIIYVYLLFNISHLFCDRMYN